MSLVPDREKRIKNAPSEPIITDPINDLARKLHPERQYLVIDNIKDETKTTKTIRLVPDPDSETKELAFFRAGQYLSLKVIVNDVETMLFESVALINGHYKEKFGFEYDILEVGYPPLEESMTPDEIKKLTIH